MSFRGKPIRRKIVALLLVPLVSLVSIWAFATYLTSREAADLMASTDALDRVDRPVHDVTHALQRERRQTLVHLADPRRSDALTRLDRQQRETDRAVATVRERVDGELRDDLDDRAESELDTMLQVLSSLRDLRHRTDASTLSRGGAFQAYNDVVDPCFGFLDSLHGLDRTELEKYGRALVGVAQAREFLSREDALMAAALAAGEVTKGDQRAFSDRIAERNLAYGASLRQMPAEERDPFENYWRGTNGRTLASYEDALTASATRDAERVVGVDRWEETTSAVLDDTQRLGFDAHERFEARIESEADEVTLRAGVAIVLGCLAVVASIVVSVRVGRSLIRDLSTLRKEANESAGVRLPSVMRRLAAGEQVDVETEAPRLDYPQDETGQVGQALNTLQRAAVEAAVKQADMRRGVSEVFVNLARRNQVLLHRQLTLLDTMERRTEDADELADLFRLDHLTTRMRRHAEGLVILSGVAPSRQWRKPVQLMDVVRAAVAEVEDYERIEVRRLPKLAVDGSAVADLTHLVAELLENATVFSPPHTAVQVHGERVANGFTLEIHDRGLGMNADALLDANLRLAETPEFELSDTDRLGLFVVSRLAQRQGVRVSLQPSPYGGTTAVVLIPGAVLTETDDRDEQRRDERRAVTRGDGAAGDDRFAALAQVPVPLLERGTVPAALDGPVELEPPLDPDEGDDADGAGGLFRPRPKLPARRRADRLREPDDDRDAAADPAANGRPARAREPEGPARAADGPAPLPSRRRGAPVLVSDHGRPVDDRRRPLDRRPPEQRRDPDADGGGPAPVPDPAPGPGTDAVPDDAPSGGGPGGGGGSAALGGLPRRVRQASIAPQLRAEAPSPAPGDGATADDAGDARTDADDERDARKVRSRMASMQRGWQRGRRESGDPLRNAAAEPRTGTTPEGEDR
ncbi:nitrate- and nitrite sensing domain-containing protein [Streptomyces sp. Z26]|uniref:nitrate- and nitrite sensing domain-containing protein n=1 Tax=Streptomyces TaxID=1883 RepID=UPI000EF14F86|nr:nitrate- and nitrite sensing domain-containing protein [Streptomyces sp. Z26]RLL69981.1 HAMP domain-containing protein [Streptomyces sp. Z26]